MGQINLNLTEWPDAVAAIRLNYHDASLKIQSVEWSLPDGTTTRIRIWDGPTLIVDQEVLGPTSGSVSIPGALKLVEDVGEDGPFLRLPDGISFRAEVRR